ncbi:hypothetical protein ACUN9Y_13750 [Halomonas sp. V046]|uniref:hypothetical protein n=1 Tax=Halomonas sp. V046 TaxID=3459611 RepID=UPI0040447204
MAQPPDNGPSARPIVPDPGDSLSGGRRRYPPPPRVWPLWLLIVVLMGVMAGGGYLAWQERERFQQQVSELRGELSNVHARFDTEQGQGDVLGDIQRQLKALDQGDRSLAAQLQALDERLGGELAETAETVQQRRYQMEQEWQDERHELDERLGALMDTLSATRTSLTAVEQTGDNARDALASRLARQDDAREAFAGRLASLTTRVDEVVTRLDSRLSQLTPRLETFEQTLDSLNDDVEAVAQSGEDGRERLAALTERADRLAAEVTDLRQSQLALSAQIEALR